MLYASKVKASMPRSGSDPPGRSHTWMEGKGVWPLVVARGTGREQGYDTDLKVCQLRYVSTAAGVHRLRTLAAGVRGRGLVKGEGN